MNLVAPEDITIIRSDNNKGVAYSTLDSKAQAERKVQYALGHLIKGSNKLVSMGIVKANTHVYKNDGYKPVIAQGTVPYSHRTHTYKFTAPDGKTWLPLLPDHLRLVIENCTLNKGVFINECRLIRNNGHYFPVDKDSELAKKAFSKAHNVSNTLKGKDLHEQDKVYLNSELYTYHGIYSVTDMLSSPERIIHKRMHVLESERHNFKLLTSVSGRLIMVKKAPAGTLPKDISVDLIDNNFRWRSVKLAAKTKQEFFKRLAAAYLKPSPIPAKLTAKTFRPFLTKVGTDISSTGYAIVTYPNHSRYSHYNSTSLATKAKGLVPSSMYGQKVNDLAEKTTDSISGPIYNYKLFTLINGKEVELPLPYL